jgi:hypothetical protein
MAADPNDLSADLSGDGDLQDTLLAALDTGTGGSPAPRGPPKDRLTTRPARGR